MKLGEQQELFLRLEARLIDKALEIGDRNNFTVRGGDAFRDPRVHGAYGEKKSYSAASSMHKLKMARDLNFIRKGVLLNNRSEFIEIGEWWEKQHELCRWGGRWNDYGHFSLTYDGKA